jgi:hypothetical protein
MNRVWLFGETSDFSKTLLQAVRMETQDVQTFGRRNISYNTHPKEQISIQYPPDKIIVNLQVSADKTSDNYDPIERWKDAICVIEFIASLFEMLEKEGKEVTIIYITSSVTISETMHEKEFYKWRDYIAVRHIQQAIWSAYDRRHLKVLAISPSRLENHNKQEYAERIVKILYNPPERRKCILDLSGAGEWRPLYVIDNIHYSTHIADVRFGIDK